jgi:hypothetical protein
MLLLNNLFSPKKMREKFAFIIALLIISFSFFAESQFTYTSEGLPLLNWKKVAADSSGQYLMAVAYYSSGYAGAVYIFGNGGPSWTSVSPDASTSTLAWHSCAISSTGQYYVAGASDKGIFVSNNYGAANSWTMYQAFSGASNFLYHMVTSNAGLRMLAVTSVLSSGAGTVYTSSNNGVGWATNVVTGSGILYGVDTDITGQYVVASGEGGIYRSTNYGTGSWTRVYANALISKFFNIASDNSGAYLVTACYDTDGGILVSTNSGTSWTMELTVSNAYSAAIGSTGQYAFVGVNGGYMYQSTDYGNNWNQITSTSKVWSGVAMLSSVKFLVSQNGGYIYTAIPTPTATPTKPPTRKPTATPTFAPTQTTASWSNQCMEGDLDFDDTGYISAGWDFYAPAGVTCQVRNAQLKIYYGCSYGGGNI